jgi:hypothetical protein
MELKSIPRAYVCIGLQVGRAPLAVAERMTGNDDNEQWPPTLAFEAFGANVKQVFGSLFSDADLVDQGRLEQARVATVREAVELKTKAKQTKIGATESFEARRAADERKRQAAEKRASERKEAAERDRVATKQKAAADDRARKDRARRLEQNRAEDVAKAERAAKASELAKERKALAASKKATATKAAALDTDKKLRATKARRTAS